jgi:hypothetical protein
MCPRNYRNYLCDDKSPWQLILSHFWISVAPTADR